LTKLFQTKPVTGKTGRKEKSNMSDLQTQELEGMVGQAQATDLAQAGEVGGQGALVQVQKPTELVPVQPKHLETAEVDTINKRAHDFLEQVRTDPSNWRLGDLVFSLGKKAMEQTQLKVGLYETKMGDVLTDVSKESVVGKTILQIKTHLDGVNPVRLGQQEIEVQEKAWRIFNKIVKRLPKSEEVIQMIAERRETVMSTVNGLQDGLRVHRDKVMLDATELGMISDQLKAVQPLLQEDIYLGQLIWKLLVEFMGTQTDAMAKEAVQNLTSDLAMGVVDLQTIDNMNLQTRFGAEQLIRNARITVRLVDRTCTTLRGAVANALGVRAAAVQQMRTQQFVEAVQESIEETMIDTAEQIGEHTVKSAQMQQKMTVSIDKIEQACNIYEQAVDAYTAITGETIKIAAESSNRLSSINDRFRARADAMTGGRQQTQA